MFILTPGMLDYHKNERLKNERLSAKLNQNPKGENMEILSEEDAKKVTGCLFAKTVKEGIPCYVEYDSDLQGWSLQDNSGCFPMGTLYHFTINPNVEWYGKYQNECYTNSDCEDLIIRPKSYEELRENELWENTKKRLGADEQNWIKVLENFDSGKVIDKYQAMTLNEYFIGKFKCNDKILYIKYNPEKKLWVDEDGYYCEHDKLYRAMFKGFIHSDNLKQDDILDLNRDEIKNHIKEHITDVFKESSERMFASITDENGKLKPEYMIDIPLDESEYLYHELNHVLKQAYNQAASGKGKERHGNGKEFTQQPMFQIADMLGSNHFMIGQAVKKAQESTRMDKDRAIRELLGSIVYLAGAVIYLENKGE